MSAVTSMEEQFNGIKDKLEAPKMEEIAGKFTALKDGLAGLSEMSGTEMFSALGDLRTQGAELAAELKTLAASVMGGESAQ